MDDRLLDFAAILLPVHAISRLLIPPPESAAFGIGKPSPGRRAKRRIKARRLDLPGKSNEAEVVGRCQSLPRRCDGCEARKTGKRIAQGRINPIGPRLTRKSRESGLREMRRRALARSCFRLPLPCNRGRGLG